MMMMMVMMSMVTNKQLDKRIDDLFQVATKPYDYTEIMQMAKERGIITNKSTFSKVGQKVSDRIHEYIFMRARQLA